MRNYKNIKRLFEQSPEAITQDDVAELELGLQPEFEQDLEFNQQATFPALPAEGQASAPVDPMTMTVGDFINKCKEIDPLICMGLESFIEKNRSAFGQSVQAPKDQDLTFSTAVTPPMPAAPNSNFQPTPSPETLNFPA